MLALLISAHNATYRLQQRACDLRCRVRGHDPVRLTRHSLTWCRDCGRDLPHVDGRVIR